MIATTASNASMNEQDTRLRNTYFSTRFHGDFIEPSVFFPVGVFTLDQVRDAKGDVWVELKTRSLKRVNQIIECIDKANGARALVELPPIVIQDLGADRIITFNRGERPNHWFTKTAAELRAKGCETREWTYAGATAKEQADADARALADAKGLAEVPTMRPIDPAEARVEPVEENSGAFGGDGPLGPHKEGPVKRRADNLGCCEQTKRLRVEEHNKALEAELEETKAELEETKGKLADATKRNNLLEMSQVSVTAELKRESDTLREASMLMEMKLRAEINTVKEQNKADMRKKDKEIKSLEKKLENNDGSPDYSLDYTLNVKNAQIETLNRNLSASKETLLSAEKERDNYLEQCKTLKEQNKALTKQNEDLETKLFNEKRASGSFRKSRRRNERKVLNLETYLEAKERDIEALQADKASLEESVLGKDGELTTLQERILAKEEELNALKAETVSLKETLVAKEQEFEGKLNVLEEQVRSGSSQVVQELEARVSRLRAAINFMSGL